MYVIFIKMLKICGRRKVYFLNGIGKFGYVFVEELSQIYFIFNKKLI